jgi:hypothetical protein
VRVVREGKGAQSQITYLGSCNDFLQGAGPD